MDKPLDEAAKDTRHTALNKKLFLSSVLIAISNCLIYEILISDHKEMFRSSIWLVMFLGLVFWSIIFGTFLAFIPFKNKPYKSRWTRVTLIMANILAGIYLIGFLILSIGYLING